MFCEGVVSEPDYLNGLKRLPHVRSNTSISIEIDPDQGVPLTLVNRAIDRNRDDEIDECWCIFDIEWPQNHPNLKEAVQLANKHGVRLAISNPCFELWLILHFEDQTAFMSTAQAERHSRRIDGRPGKRVDPAQYLPHRDAAAKRASALIERHTRNHTMFPHNNPSSTVGELLTSIES